MLTCTYLHFVGKLLRSGEQQVLQEPTLGFCVSSYNKNWQNQKIIVFVYFNVES